MPLTDEQAALVRKVQIIDRLIPAADPTVHRIFNELIALVEQLAQERDSLIINRNVDKQLLMKGLVRIENKQQELAAANERIEQLAQERDEAREAFEVVKEQWTRGLKVIAARNDELATANQRIEKLRANLENMECSCHEQQRHSSNDHCSQNVALETLARDDEAAKGGTR